MASSTLEPVISHSEPSQNGQDANTSSSNGTSTIPPTTPTNPSHEEYQYLNLINDILQNGEHRPDRTGTGTYAIPFPPQLKFSLSRPSPPPHTQPSSSPSSPRNVRAYLDSVGLSHYDEGELGPVYGFQWRHFGAEYRGHAHDYTGEGVDQLADVIDKLRNKPHDRRIILSAWNPADLKKMALPPCHMFAQFYVSFPKGAERGVLHSLLYQRSCDMGLGVPFNIASYALLTHMLAHVCDLTPGTFTHTMGDAHVYADHVEALKVQLEREPREFPMLNIKRDGGGSIDGWTPEEFEVVGYKPHSAIAMKMSV
ncbi:thymidylate synthase/dCMP hydroxymethylase domain-containing protein [Phaeosphaeriaceae sp. PMI808]|nr:thymidylate synthase/dCMP hydroxymethylase domain-containing protein [Phaeosphaeriaceae sp. PMI808]